MGKRRRNDQWDDEEERKMRQAGQEDLNEYIRATKPGTLIVILSLLILTVSTIVWGFAGTLPVTETVTGVALDKAAYEEALQGGSTRQATGGIFGEEPETDHDEAKEIVILCFVDAFRYNGQAVKNFSDKVKLVMPDQNEYTGTIEKMFNVPVSTEEAKEILFGNEWAVQKCISQDYSWLLVIRPDEDLSQYTVTLTDVTFLTEEVAPIRFLMR